MNGEAMGILAVLVIAIAALIWLSKWVDYTNYVHSLRPKSTAVVDGQEYYAANTQPEYFYIGNILYMKAADPTQPPVMVQPQPHQQMIPHQPPMIAGGAHPQLPHPQAHHQPNHHQSHPQQPQVIVIREGGNGNGGQRRNPGHHGHQGGYPNPGGHQSHQGGYPNQGFPNPGHQGHQGGYPNPGHQGNMGWNPNQYS